MAKPLPAPPRTPELQRLAKEIQKHIDQGDRDVTRGVQQWIEAGRKLAQARELCAHGEWKPWIEQNFPNLPYRTAMGYINIFERFGAKPASVAGLSGPVVRMLSAPSTPKEVVDDTIADAKAGKPIAAATIKRKIQEAKPKPAITITGTNPPKPTPPITIAAAPTDHEGARQYALQLQAKRDAAEKLKQEDARDAKLMDTLRDHIAAHDGELDDAETEGPLKVQPAAEEAQKPEAMQEVEDESDLNSDLDALEVKDLLRVSACCVKHVTRVIGKCTSALPCAEHPKLLKFVKGAVDYLIKQEVEQPAEEAAT